jgi:hypothetical protein
MCYYSGMKYRTPLAVLMLAIFAVFAIRFVYQNITPKPVVADSIDGDTDAGTDDASQNYVAAVNSAQSAPHVKYAVSSSTPQFVLFSFDGSKSVAMLDETLAFEQKMQAEKKPLHFTYFINAAYFITDANAARLYQPPAGHPAGTSAIGFSDTTADIATRVSEFNKAFLAGNDIGSHSTGHFDGTAWTYDQWKQEFDSFTGLMANVQKNNPSVQIAAPNFLADIHGFRAPNLGVNPNLYKLLGDDKFTYDGSGVGSGDTWPTQDSNGVWHIPLGLVYLGANKNPVISMDYNLWMRQSNATEMATSGTPLWNQYYNEVESAYAQYFNANYNGNRGPIVIADHFSKWNDGVYWEALKTFAENVCGMPNVRCGTFKDVVAYMNTTGAPPIAQ